MYVGSYGGVASWREGDKNILKNKNKIEMRLTMLIFFHAFIKSYHKEQSTKNKNESIFTTFFNWYLRVYNKQKKYYPYDNFYRNYAFGCYSIDIN